MAREEKQGYSFMDTVVFLGHSFVWTALCLAGERSVRGGTSWQEVITAIPFGMLCAWLIEYGGFVGICQWLVKICKWLGIPITGIFFIVILLHGHLHTRAILVFVSIGIAYLILGELFAIMAKREQSAALSVNTFSAFVLGLGIVMAGIFVLFRIPDSSLSQLCGETTWYAKALIGAIAILIGAALHREWRKGISSMSYLDLWQSDLLWGLVGTLLGAVFGQRVLHWIDVLLSLMCLIFSYLAWSFGLVEVVCGIVQVFS
jgi:hypothetical protein